MAKRKKATKVIKSMTKRDEFLAKIKESWPSVGSDSDYGWTSLNKSAIRDLDITTQKRMQEIAFYLYDSNPMAHRILELTKDFVIGDGFKFKAEDESVKDVLDKFWNDADNNWNMKQDTKALELGLWGEQCYPVQVNQHNGHVKLGYLDPGLISKVKMARGNPENMTKVYYRTGKYAQKERVLDIIRTNNDARSSKRFNKLEGDCFFFAINKVAWSSRGRSDLLCLHPDTLVNTVDKGNVPIKDLVGQDVSVYSWDREKNALTIGKATNIRKTRKNAKLVKVHFTNGDSIITTPDHLILLIDGKTYREAKDFLSSDRVQAVARKIKDDYIWIQYKKSKWMLEHRFIMETILGRKLSSNELVHHKNRNTFDNRISNLQLISRADHAALHMKETLLTPAAKKKTLESLQKRMKGNTHAKGNTFNLTPEQIEKEKKALKKMYKNMSDEQRQKLVERNTKASHARFQPGKKINQYATFNHEVLYVEELDYTSDVYDLDVEKYHNFSANGIILHNCLSDWLDGYDQFLFARLERAFFLNTWIWDVMCKGMNENEITEFAKKQVPPKPGSARYHNENIEWNVVSPQLDSSDASGEANMFKMQILGGAGFPNHWFGEGDKTTRATALEMGLPTLRKLKSRQQYFKYMLVSIFNFVIDQAIIHGTLDEDVNRNFVVIPSPILTKNARDVALTLDKFTTGLQGAVDNKWISQKSAGESFRTFISQLGIEIQESKEEREEYENEKPIRKEPKSIEKEPEEEPKEKEE